MLSQYFGDGIGPRRQTFFEKSHGACSGLHLYITDPVGPNANLIRKFVWTANHWVDESRFIRVKVSPIELRDYSFGKSSELLKVHYTIFSGYVDVESWGLPYLKNWGPHKLTKTKEREFVFGDDGIKQRTAWNHYHEKYGEFSISQRDLPPGIDNVFRRSVVKNSV